MSREAMIYGDQVDHYENTIILLCVDRKVHIAHSEGENVDDMSACGYHPPDPSHYEEWSIMGPCDGTCDRRLTIPDFAEELVNKFLATGETSSLRIELGELPYNKRVCDYPFTNELVNKFLANSEINELRIELKNKEETHKKVKDKRAQW